MFTELFLTFCKIMFAHCQWVGTYQVSVHKFKTLIDFLSIYFKIRTDKYVSENCLQYKLKCKRGPIVYCADIGGLYCMIE